jgi:hypothetical protein
VHSLRLEDAESEQPVDILAHGLWVGIGLAAVSRRRPISRRTALLTVGLAVLPDIVHLVPVLALSVAQPGGFVTLQAYANALPGLEPSMPPLVESLSHHLHCILHSALVAAAVTAAVWVVRRSLWIPLLGWWSHIIIDVFTHSAEFYPSPVLYPVTRAGFDGIAWNTPWFILVNYTALVIALVVLVLTRRSAAKA